MRLTIMRGHIHFMAAVLAWFPNSQLDYMHLVCLSVRRMLHIWFRGPLNFRIPANIAERMSPKLDR